MKLLEQIQSMRFPAALPGQLLVVEQQFHAPQVKDLEAAVRQQLEAGGLLARLHPGARVAVGVGSRGITDLVPIVRAAIRRLQEAQVQPFIIPAMGSHGGATPEGQRALLAELGITEQSMGVEIRATMEVQPVGVLEGGPELFQDVFSAGADATLLINRIKPHTDFHSHLESGLTKMAVIGLGKRRGAEALHAFGADGFRRFLEPAAKVYRSRTNLIGGLAILENAFGRTAEIVGLTADQFGGPREQELLARARSLMARLPFDQIDILVIREIGKNYSGTGMDTNIVRRLMIPREAESGGSPDIAIIAVLDISEPSEGNAAGIGLANVTTQRVFEKIDWKATYTNSVTSGIFGMQRVALPITMADDQRALEVAVRGCGRMPEQARMVFINNTSKLGTLWVSPNLRAAVESEPHLRITGEAPLSFSASGDLTSPWQMN